MSVEVSSWAWRQRVGDAGAKLALLKLADQANDEGECWPSRATIAEDCECDISSVKRRIRRLRELGLIVIEPRYEDGRQTSNLYRLQLGVTSAPPRGATAPSRGVQPRPPRGWHSYDPAEPSEEPSLNRGTPPRQRDVVWDTLVEILGEPTNKQARSKRNAAVKYLKESLATRELPTLAEDVEIRRRANYYRRLWPNVSLTDTALATHWDELVPPRARFASSPDPEPEVEAAPPEVALEHLRKLGSSIGREIA